MAKLLLLLLSLALVLGLASCGGGGSGGGTVRITGRILSVSTGGSPNPPANVQIGTTSVVTQDGSGVFIINVPPGASSMLVTHPVFPSFVFTFPAVTSNTDLGDFWIGPEKVIINGSVIDAQTSLPVEGASIRFAGQRAVTNSRGEFTLNDVAFDSGNSFVFFGIVGLAQKTGYVPAEFNVNQDPVAGVITLPSILLAPVSDPNPPGPPFNLWGVITLQGGGSPAGTIVTLLESGTPVRLMNVGNDGRYTFWAPPAVYEIRFEKDGYVTVTIDITNFTAPDQVIRNDVTLIPEP